jgi:CubicO group peptidase (beta-lactamase class C family)
MLGLLAGALALCASVLASGGEQSEGSAPALAPLDAAAAAASDLPRLNSLLVSQGGGLVLEKYFNGARAARPANVKSVSKSVISALVGIAIERGAIESARQPIVEFFPELRRGTVDPAKRAITVEDLLTMRSGLDSTSGRNYGAWVRSANWVRHILDKPLLTEPGTVMDYSTGNSHLLSAILTRATGVSTWQFAQQRLAKPLGFTLARWPQDPQGVFFGGNEMLLTPRQMIAFGELYLNRGSVGGSQVIPSSWVDASFVPRARSYWSEQLYGYGWWMRQIGNYQTYFAWGFGGQYIFIVPELRVVIATTSVTSVGEERRGHRRALFDLIEQLLENLRS